MNSLTPIEWELIFALPADGEVHHVEGVAFRAVHYPATRMKCEAVIAETRFGTIRRIKVGGKWKATDYVPSLSR